MTRRALALIAALSFCSVAARHRAVAPPADPAPAAWLALHATPLASVEATGSLDDLEPLRAIVGNANVVALADGTHGTHEYFTTKLRIIEFLVTRMGFDTLALEGTFPQIARVDAYVQGQPVDIRTAIFPQQNEIDYHFWAVDEFIAVADWLRNYNLSRGDKPAVSVAGIDVWDGAPAAAEVVSYLQKVDPAAAADASSKYLCVESTFSVDPQCAANTAAVGDAIAANEASYVSRSSQREFDDALHAATVAGQSLAAMIPAERNHNMALNVEWARTHRSSTGRAIVWGHGEHFGKTTGVEGVETAGMWLAQMDGSGYVAVGNAMWDGSYLGLDGTTSTAEEMVIHVAPVDPDGYENFFHAGPPAFLLSLHGPLHSFLMQAHHLRTAGFSVDNNWDLLVDIRKKFDAIVYVEFTPPPQPLP